MEMDDLSRAKIRDVKSKIMAMLEERQTSRSGGDASLVLPSDYWTDFCSYFDYMIGMKEEAFAKLRLHTYHLTGETYLTYYFGDPSDFDESIEALTKNIPHQFVINEPEGGIGFHYSDGRFVSYDIMKFQRMINSIYRHGILAALKAKRRSNILEIGGGYGGLAHHLSSILNNTTYFIVDLPETLLFAASYISLLNPNKRVYLYDKATFPDLVKSGFMDSWDFVLLPNYKLDSIGKLQFDLSINIASLQEMRTEQVEEYLDFIRQTCTGNFYSFNQDHQPRNAELLNLSDMLKARFELIGGEQTDPRRSITRILKRAILRPLKTTVTVLGLIDRAYRKKPDLPYREYICKPLPLGRSLPSGN